MSFGAGRWRALRLNAGLRGALAGSLLVGGLLAGCGSQPTRAAGPAAEPDAPEPPPVAQLDGANTSQVAVADPPQRDPAVVAVQPTSAPAQIADTPESRRAELEAIDTEPRYEPSALAGAVQPSRLKAGLYRCSVGEGYKLRDCRVEKDSQGRTFLEIGSGNLVAARGVVWDDGAISRFEGWLTERRPFGCFSCQDRCYIEPKSCGCNPAPLGVAKACVAQPVEIVLSGAGNQYKGTLSYSHFYASYEGVGEERHLVPGRTAQSYPVRLLFQKPLRSGCGGAGSAGPPCGNYRPTPNRGGALNERL